MLDHLLRGVKKGAFDETEAKRRFEEWKTQKASKIQATKDQLSSDDNKKKEEALKAEKAVNEKRAEELSKRFAEEVAEETTEVVEEETKTEEATAEKAEEKKTEE